MRIGFACAAAMWVALAGSGVRFPYFEALLALALIGGMALSSKLDAIARVASRD